MSERIDKIHIRDLRCRCIIGINPNERTDKQDVVINISIDADLEKACASDSIDDTIDYKRVKQAVLTMVEDSSCFLIEHLAERIAEVCLREPKARRVCVTVDKPGALRFARSVAVEITRSRAGHDA